MKKPLGKRILSATLSVLLAAGTVLTPNLPLGTMFDADAADDGKITIEARVIFGDYNDDGVHTYEGCVPSLNLQYREGGTVGNYYGEAVTPEFVVDDTKARKDWCYQYKYVWEVDPLKAEEGSATGYYVSVGKTGENFLRDNYYVYYLPERQFGDVGDPNNAGYKTSAQQVFFNEDAVIYIFLDPKVDWKDYVWEDVLDENGDVVTDENGKAVQEIKLNDDGTYYGEPKDADDIIPSLTFKKRWDGHNEGKGSQIKQHENEKIEVQLQYYDPDTRNWVEFKDPNYYNYCFYEKEYTFTDENGETKTAKGFIDKKNVVTGIEEEIAPEDRFQLFGDDYLTPDGEYVDANSLVPSETDPGRTNRFKVYRGIEHCNNIVLTLNGDNHPQHFTNGYYYNWNELPYNQYRVVEMQTFIDNNNNNNDLFDAGVDIDTSSEYFYVTFPPSRDSSGILHMQNFTPDMKLSVQKEWYTDVSEEGRFPIRI